MNVAEVKQRVAAAAKMNVLERGIAAIAPRVAMQRLQARTQLAVAGGYDGGRRERRGTKRWRPLAASADADILGDLPDLRGRSRDLARNVPIATGAIATKVTNVVADGLRLKACINREWLGITDEQADAMEREQEREWALFCKTCDVTRVQQFNEIQALLYRAERESGDAFVVRRFRKDVGDVYGTKLQVLEADRVCNPNRQADSDTIAGGVEVDKDGVHVAYHVTDRHPGNLRTAGLKWNRIAARTEVGLQVVLHLYGRLRPEQTRGIPDLAPVIEHLKLLGDYTEAELRAAVVSAFYTVFIESDADDSENPIAGETDSALADNEVKLGSGAIISLAKGEKANNPSPGRPNTAFDPFVQALLRQIGVALELPFELLIKHFTASYSASRAAIEMAWQLFRKDRIRFARSLCQPVYEWMMEEAVARGRLSRPGYFEDPMTRVAYCGSSWIGAPRPTIDPVKDATADQANLDMEVTTREEIRAERYGDRGDWESVHAQRVKEERMRRKDGMSDVNKKPVSTSADPNVSDNTSDDETQPQRTRG